MGGRKPYELIGKRFGRLLVTQQEENKNGYTQWRCKCCCGNEVIVQGTRLVGGKTKSCGCLSRDKTASRNKLGMKYNTRGNRLYHIYWGMRTRCYNKSSPDYRRYGGRGIIICDEWLNNFKAFESWALANGYKDNLSIDRINNDGNYEPLNCRWATNEQQQANKTNPGSNHKAVLKLDCNGDVLAEYPSISEASRITGAKHVGCCCNGIRKTSGGYQWRFKKGD